MRRTACLLAALVTLATAAAAQPATTGTAAASSRRHVARTPAVDRVPEQATNGKPGSANSPKPDANVPPAQTPSEPIAGVKR